jgi:lipid-binding SYLF domain-containing protein
LFAGIDLSGGVLRPDKEADARAYGSNVTARQVAENTGIASPDAAQPFLKALSSDVRATTGRKK